MPSVTTSQRVVLLTAFSNRIRYPMVLPASSFKMDAMRMATALVASRRGSSITIFLPCSHGSSSKSNGNIVLLPAPGGA
jgi:hypothetical protein